MRKIILPFFLLFIPVSASADDLRLVDLANRLKEESIGISVVDLGSGKEIDSFRGDAPLIPASVQKVVLSGAALKALGPEYRFRTVFYGTQEKNGNVPLLGVQGGGDPDLTIEKLWMIVRELRQRGVRRIDTLLLDGTKTPDSKPQTGERAYEGPSGALSVNFNAVEVELCPGRDGRASIAKIDPVEVDTRKLFPAPLSFPAGQLKCSKSYRSVGNPLLYFQEIFVALLRQNGIQVNSVSQGAVRDGMPVLYAHESKPLRGILDDMNHYSTNFIAEQVLAALGGGEDGRLVRQRGLSRMQQYAESLGVEESSFKFVDGSGLSRDNRLSARLLVRIMQDMFFDPEVGADFTASLSVARRSGTLKERDYGDLPVFRGKTGTIDGVSSLTGLFFLPDGRIFSLAVIQNQVENKDRAFELERGLLSALNAR